MRRRIGKLLQTLFAFALIAWLLFYLYQNRELFLASVDVSWGHIAGLAFCVLASWAINALQVQILLRMEEIPVGFWENFTIQTATFLGNILPMRAGTIMRFVYFKKFYGLEYSRFGGIVVLRTLLLVMATGFLGCLALLGLDTVNLSIYAILWTSFGGMFLLPILAWWLPNLEVLLPANRIGRIGRKFISGFSTIKARPKLAATVLMLMLVQFVLLSVRLLISFDALQISLSGWMLLLLSPVTTLLSFMTITPGNLGLREWVIGLLSQAGGYHFETGIFAGVIDRTVQMTCIFLLGSLAMVWVWLRLRSFPSVKSQGMKGKAGTA